MLFFDVILPSYGYFSGSLLKMGSGIALALFYAISGDARLFYCL
jgi:hypothetical protein